VDKEHIDEDGDECWSLLSIYGFISTSTSHDLAISFANDDLSLKKHATLYEIQWKREKYQRWYFDKSSFPEEQEILIFGRSIFKKVSVK
jgi:hypothetical protein